MNNNTNYSTGICLLVILSFFLVAGYVSAQFLISTIIPLIGIWNLILIPIAWECIKMGLKTIVGLFQVVCNLDKIIEKDN